MSSVMKMLDDISEVGRDKLRGGYSRPVYSSAELELREWFAAAASSRGLSVESDRNGIVWAWWDVPGRERRDAAVTGSHLDSVPGGGAFDGPLGIASALIAIDQLKARGFQPDSPLAIAVFPEEEGSRFGQACLGSRILTGQISADTARGLRDDSGVTFAEHTARAGIDPGHLGADPESLAQIGTFVELHVEQGRGLIDHGQPVAIASGIIGHGRWKLRIQGQGNHAGTTRMDDRRDPMLVAARAILAIEDTARGIPEARATVGRLTPFPGGTNVIASAVDLWIDVRHPDDAMVSVIVDRIAVRSTEVAESAGCTTEITRESLSPRAVFDRELSGKLGQMLPMAPYLDTGAGHDAGVLSRVVPSAMLFVRNPSGISHSPEEHVEADDAEHGAAALAGVLAGISTNQRGGG